MPFPDNPVLVLTHRRAQYEEIARGRLVQQIKTKHSGRLLGAGIAVQWASFLMALSQHGLWTPVAYGLNGLGLVSILTKGRQGGYLGWLLPATIERQRLEADTTFSRLAPDLIPQAGTEFSVKLPGLERTLLSGEDGTVAIDLGTPLKGRTFASDQPVAVRIRVPQAQFEREYRFQISEILYPYYLFNHQPYFYNRTLAGSPAGYTLPHKAYKVVSKTPPDTYGVQLPGGVFYLDASHARLSHYGASPDPGLDPPRSWLSFGQITWESAPAATLPSQGANGWLLIELINQSGQTIRDVYINLSSLSGPELTFPTVSRAGHLAPGTRRTVRIPVALAATAPPREHALDLEARTGDDQVSLGRRTYTIPFLANGP